MDAKETYRNLRASGACPNGLKWAKGKDLETIWNTCPHAAWLLWLLTRLRIDGFHMVPDADICWLDDKTMKLKCFPGLLVGSVGNYTPQQNKAALRWLRANFEIVDWEDE
jgi:hypothetical protein